MIMRSSSSQRAKAAAFVAVLMLGSASVGVPVGPAGASSGTGSGLQQALERFVASPNGPPAIVVVLRGDGRTRLLTAGTSEVGTATAPKIDDHIRVASVAKAFTGATALSVVADGLLDLDSTIGEVRPDLPAAWSKVTLAQLLQHTSGIPDFSGSGAFREALGASLLTAPPPITLLSYVADDPLEFRPGSKYQYSNSDNIAAALMVETATGAAFATQLQQRVVQPLRLTGTSLPDGAAMPTPYIHGYTLDPPGPPEDVSELFAAGWSWASGGVIATPGDANRFIRGYAAGKTTNRSTYKAQFRFRPGSSEPPGPGTNAAGLAIFRYRTRCGTVYGHTGNTAGYTQFVAATRDGLRAVSVTVNAQITPKADAQAFRVLRAIYGQAVCAVLDD